MSQISALTEMAKKIIPDGWFRSAAKYGRFFWGGALGVALLIIGGMYDSYITQPIKPKIDITPDTTKTLQVQPRSYEEILEGKLANVLSQIRGVGSVTVNITLDHSGQIEHAKNIVKESRIVQEKDNAGGVRTTTEVKDNEQILLVKDNGSDRPVIVKETKPVIKGVLVIAEGAYDSNTKNNITKAVETTLGIPSYRITVLPQRK